ncbi:heme ABC exporter ATP-binding protein CcmA [Marinicella rhabdoformis]|uniref:heme ABC exporter ATP-binding protein CcmA n=1 Tax=Marinicella rhabdoformis TaxID=2580566 RepID=UPI0012AEB562|nr:heme ABC exporter ATP-binding protein CcmA [Marinicella rhabdoformis]
MSHHHLHISNITCARGGEDLFEPVSCLLHTGELAVIAGPNGSGKTTLMETLAGMRPLASGDMSFNDSQQSALWLANCHYLGHKLGNKGNLSCLENLSFALKINQVNASTEQMEAALEAVDLAGYEYHLASELSAGQKKRLALSRLLLLNKSFWLLDEPFVNLDHAGCDWLYQTIAAHIAQGGAVMLTAHDQQKIHELAHHHIDLIVSQPDEVQL